MFVRTQLAALLTVILAAGCEYEPPVETVAIPDTLPAASTFDAANTGTVTGRVTWAGPIPAVPPFIYGIPKDDGNFDARLIPNPNRPDIDATTKAVAGAVVFLRDVNPTAAKPWDHPPVTVELKDRNVVVRQGEAAPRRVGFVRRGDRVEMKLAEPLYHVLRGRGADFFSLTFPDPGSTLTRTFDKPGRVELSSGAGYYWASADLFVADHPYYAVTDRAGRFTLAQVPAGPVEVVAWVPGWEVARQDRDPETGMVTRQQYAPPLEAVGRATLDRGRTADVNLTLTVPAK